MDTTEHELFHMQQYHYGYLNDPFSDWVVEGQARSSQDKVCIGVDRSNCVHFDHEFHSYIDYVRSYLGNPNRSITKASDWAALFWTYLVEKYGTSALYTLLKAV